MSEPTRNADYERRPLPEVHITPGQRQYLDSISTYGILEDTGRSWWASVRYGLRAYGSHRAAVRKLGDWLPWHDRPENQQRLNDGPDSSGPCACPDHDASETHPLGRYWFGTHNDGAVHQFVGTEPSPRVLRPGGTGCA